MALREASAHIGCTSARRAGLERRRDLVDRTSPSGLWTGALQPPNQHLGRRHLVFPQNTG